MPTQLRPGGRFHAALIGPFVIAVVLLAALGFGSAYVLSGVRAYVGGESMWSKGQKDAVFYLTAYATSRRAEHYQRFADAIAIPLGDRVARLELEKSQPDLAVARRGFLEGGNHADDIDAMIWLFRSFRRVPFMADAIAIWAEADTEIPQLHRLAERLHDQVMSGDENATNREAAMLLAQLEPLNQRLTELEHRFSQTMSEASRRVQRLIQGATLLLALALVAAALLISSGLLRSRARAEAALRASERRFRQLWEGAPDAIVMFGGDMRIRYANAAVRTLFGQDPQEIVGQSVTVLHPESARETYPGSGGELQGQRTELDALGRDGRVFPVEVSFSRNDTDAGEPIFAAFLRDVSARKQIMQALRTSEERLQRALDASGLCLWDVDVVTGNVFLSEGWSLQLGGPREVTRTTFAALIELVPENERQTLIDAFMAAVGNPSTRYRVEHRVKRRDGEVIWNLSEGRVVEHDAKGRAVRLVGTNRDITERKAAEVVRLALEAQLRESQKMEAVGTLAAGVAHDFNNILGAILGNLAIAREDVGAGNAVLHSLERINKSALRARSLVQQILAFGRRQPHALENRPLRPMLEETLALMRSTLPAGVIVEAVLPNEPLHVMADATQFQQVVMNLCTNAWHALQGRCGRIVVGLERSAAAAATVRRRASDPPEGAQAHVWVSDSGCGMSAATRSRIFEPFFTTKPVGQGTGLGLSVVHGIVAAHGGMISVDSAPGQGSTFHLYFPLVDVEQCKPNAGWDGLSPLQPSGQGQHVLYLDDDELMLLLVDQLLQRLGYRVTCFQHARQALAALTANHDEFDLVVSDYNMPEVSGLDIAREVARIRAGLPIVISSGYLNDEQRRELLRSGVCEIVRKENTLEELGPSVNRALQGIAA